MRAVLLLSLLPLALALLGPAPAGAAQDKPLFFDDFSHADRAALIAAGWMLREAPGLPPVRRDRKRRSGAMPRSFRHPA